MSLSVQPGKMLNEGRRCAHKAPESMMLVVMLKVSYPIGDSPGDLVLAVAKLIG